MTSFNQHTVVTQPYSDDDREKISKAFDTLAKAFKDGHGATDLHEAGKLLQQKGLLTGDAALLPLFVAGQHKAIKERDGKK